MNNEMVHDTKVIAFVNPKGGTSKSTTSINLALYLVSKGEKVLFIDADIQKTACKTFAKRDLLKLDGPVVIEKTLGLVKHVMQMMGSYGYIIIDTQGADSNVTRDALAVANWAISPFSYTGFDVSEIGKVVEMILKAKNFNKELITFFLPSMVIKQRTKVKSTERSKAEINIIEAIEISGYGESTPEELNIHLLKSEISLNAEYTKMDEGKSVFELSKGKTHKPMIEYVNLLKEIVLIVNSKEFDNQEVA